MGILWFEISDGKGMKGGEQGDKPWRAVLHNQQLIIVQCSKSEWCQTATTLM
jgi:hypothetical protein